MTGLTMSLPESMRAFVEDQAARSGLGLAEHYFLTPIRNAQAREEKARLEAMLLDALNSGEPIEVNDAYWKQFRARLVERHGPGRADGL